MTAGKYWASTWTSHNHYRTFLTVTAFETLKSDHLETMQAITPARTCALLPNTIPKRLKSTLRVRIVRPIASPKPALQTRSGNPRKVTSKAIQAKQSKGCIKPDLRLPTAYKVGSRCPVQEQRRVLLATPHNPKKSGGTTASVHSLAATNKVSHQVPDIIQKRSHLQGDYILSFKESCRLLRERLDLAEANTQVQIQLYQQRLHHSTQSKNHKPRIPSQLWWLGDVQLMPLEKLGKGASGTVISAQDINRRWMRGVGRNLEVAVKVMPLSQRQCFDREIEFMRALGPARLSTQLLAAAETNKSLILVMSRGETSLYDRVNGLPPERRRLGQEECKRLIKELVLLVDSMHRKGFVHFDLKPDNILITQEGDLVLCDGSLAATLAETKVEKYFMRGTPGYMAPEIVDADPIALPLAADMYAIGAILAFLRDFEPRKPLSDFRRHYLIEDAFPIEEYELANDILAGLLCEQPEFRYTAEDVLHHPWLDGVRLGTRSIRWWKGQPTTGSQGPVDIGFALETIKQLDIY